MRDPLCVCAAPADALDSRQQQQNYAPPPQGYAPPQAYAPQSYPPPTQQPVYQQQPQHGNGKDVMQGFFAEVSPALPQPSRRR